MSANKALILRADAEWRRVVKLRNGSWCVCGRQASECHHIFGRGYSVRWDLINGIYLCRECHQYAHANPVDFKFFMFCKLGPTMFGWLMTESEKVERYRSGELNDVISGLKKMGDRLATESSESLAEFPPLNKPGTPLGRE